MNNTLLEIKKMNQFKKYFYLLFLLPTSLIAQNLILDGSTIPLDSSSSISIDPSTGDITATSQAGDLTCSSSSTAPTLSAVTANPTSVISGGSSTISWTLSGQATSCTKSGDWSGTFTGSDVTDGSHSSVVNGITANSTYSLQCSNNIGSSALLSANVTLASSANCVNQPPILSGNEDLTIIANGTANSGTYDGTYKDFQQVASPVDWPGNWGDSISLSLTRNQYISASFITNSNNDLGRFQMATPGNTQGPASSTTLVISECPGDFTTHLNQAKCQKIVGPSGSLKWATDPNASASSYCKLEKNTFYYLNIVHSITPTDSIDPADNFSTSSCGASYCGILAVQVQE
jgi:hypothetical protein